jgi:hypothetical protein
MTLIGNVAEALHLKGYKHAQKSSVDRKAVFDDSKITVIYVLGGPGAGRIRCFSFYIFL